MNKSVDYLSLDHLPPPTSKQASKQAHPLLLVVMAVIWGARAADAQPSARVSHQDGNGAAVSGGDTEQQKNPSRLEANCHDSFGNNLGYYQPYQNHVFSPHHVHSALSTSAPHLDDGDGDSSSPNTTPITPYPPLPAVHGHFLHPGPGSEPRRSSLAFNEDALSSIRAAFTFDANHQQSHSMLPGPPLDYRMDDMGNNATASHPSRSSRGPFPSEQPPARMAAYTTNLALRQGPSSGSRFHPGPVDVQSSMALDDCPPGSTRVPRAGEPGGEPNKPRADEASATTARRPRGRPRLETSDETPIDVSPTVAHLAQLRVDPTIAPPHASSARPERFPPTQGKPSQKHGEKGQGA